MWCVSVNRVGSHTKLRHPVNPMRWEGRDWRWYLHHNKWIWYHLELHKCHIRNIIKKDKVSWNLTSIVAILTVINNFAAVVMNSSSSFPHFITISLASIIRVCWNHIHAHTHTHSIHKPKAVLRYCVLAAESEENIKHKLIYECESESVNR